MRPDPRAPSPDELVLAAAALGRPELLTHAHPVNNPGPYVVPRRLRRVLQVRSPRCEWPGCGRRALKAGPRRGCDIDHDLAWPGGPTCGCNTGPLCRRHHRIKQLGWVKERRVGGHVRWTSLIGRAWLSRNQHQPPPAPARPLPPLPVQEPLIGLTDAQRAEVLWHHEPDHPIFDAHGLREAPEDIEPPDIDSVGERYRWGDLWVRLNDPTAWHENPDGDELPSG